MASAAADDPGNWTPLWPRLDVAQLEHVLIVLKRYYNFISLSDAVDIIAGRRPPQSHSMVLTFDDGYLNNYSIALPVLERLDVPATFFVCPGMMESERRYWIDRLDYAIQHLPEQHRIVSIAGRDIDLRTSSREVLADAYRQLRLRLKSSYSDDFDAQADSSPKKLERAAGCSIRELDTPDPWADLMDWSQARRASAKGYEIGATPSTTLG